MALYNGNCKRLENIVNLSLHFIRSKVYLIPDQYFLRFEDVKDYTETTLSKLECNACGPIILSNIWKKSFERIIGFDLSAEGTEFLFYSNSHVHVYSFFNEIIEHVKKINFQNFLPIEIFSRTKNVSSIMSIQSTLHTAKFIACFEDNQMFYFIVDINRDVVEMYVELHRAQCCSWNMEFVYTLTHEGTFCKYSTVSADLVDETFNIHTVIPKVDKELKFQLLKISCNNKDACLVDEQGNVYLFQIDEDQSDVETGLDICMELDDGSTANSYESQSKKKWSFFDKILKKNKQDEVCYVDPSPVESASSVCIIKNIIPDPRNMELFSVEFLTQGLVVWTTDSSGGNYRIFSRDKGELMYNYHFNGPSCLLHDPTLKHEEDPSYQFVTTEQALLIPVGSESGGELLKQEAANTSESSKWRSLLEFISSSRTPFLINDDIILQILDVSFVQNQLDILEYCLDYHLNQFMRDVCETSLDSRSVSSSVVHGKSLTSSACEVSMTSSRESGNVKALLNMTGMESMEMLDRMLKIVTQWEAQAETTFYGKCLERIMSHLVQMAKLCNDKDSRKLSYEILKQIPALLSTLYVKCNHPVDVKAWDCLDSTQILYLTLHSPQYNVQGGSMVLRPQVMTLLEECIENRDFLLVQSVLNKMDYNIDAELKSVFESTLNQETRDFILDHMGRDLLDQQEYEAYTCYREMQNAYSRLLEQKNNDYDPGILSNENQRIVENYQQRICNEMSSSANTIDENSHGKLTTHEKDNQQFDQKNNEKEKPSLSHGINDPMNDCQDESTDTLLHEINKELNEKTQVTSRTMEESFNIAESDRNITDNVDDVCTDGESKKKVALCTNNLLRISFGEYKTFSKETIMEIIVKLYFQSYDESLLEYLTKEICWKHLVKYSMLQQLEAWIIGSASWAVSKQWTMSQPMIDAVHTLSTTSATQEFILNQFCSTFGIFSSRERSNVLLIVSRLIECQLLSRMEEVLCSTTSNVSLEYFTTQLILLCIEREQWTLLSCLLENFQDLSVESRSLKPVKLWSYLDETFNSPSLSSDELMFLISNVADMFDCAHDSNVNISKYFIATSKKHIDSQKHNITEPYDVVERSKNQGMSQEDISGLVSETSLSKSQQEIKPESNDKFTISEPEEKRSESKVECRLAKSQEIVLPEIHNTAESSYSTELLTISSFYSRTLISPDSTIRDINLAALSENNPVINFSSVLSRKYTSMKNQSSLKFQLSFLHHLKQGRVMASYYDKSRRKLLHNESTESCLSYQGIEPLDFVDLNEMYATVLNSPHDSGLVTSALNVLRLQGVDEACFANQVRSVRCLNEEDIGDILARKQIDSSRSDLIDLIIEKCVLHCTGIQSWSPTVDLCKLHHSPIPVQLFDSLIRENRWMEFLVACDVFDYADGDKLIHRFTSPTTRQHLKYALALSLAPTDPAPDDLMELIECCHSNQKALLDASLVHSVPCLALLASVLPSSDSTPSRIGEAPAMYPSEPTEPAHQCLRVYLQACMEMKQEEEELSLIQIMGVAVEQKCLALLDDGLQMLVPDSPLSHFVSALCDFIMFDAQHTPSRLGVSIASLNSSSTPSQQWTVQALVSLTHKALTLLSSCAQRELLSTLRDAGFDTIFGTAQQPTGEDSLTSGTQGSLSTVLSIAQCLQRTDICVDFSQLWPVPSQEYAHSILCSLLNRKLFPTAQEFCALSNISAARVVMAQWRELIAQEKFTSDLGFWKAIDEDFRSHSVSDVEAFEFFSSVSPSVRSPVDRYKCLKLGLDRCDVVPPELHRQLYTVCLSGDFDLSCLHDVWGFNPTPADRPVDVSYGFARSSAGKLEATVGSTNTTSSTIDGHINTTEASIDTADDTSDTTHPSTDSTMDTSLPQPHESRLQLLVSSMLDRGDLASASVVSQVFHWEHPDCIVLKQMAKAATQRESGEDVLSQLCSKLRHGKTIGLFFVAAYRLLCSLDLTMEDILVTDPNLILWRIRNVDLPLQCVQDLVCLASMQLTQGEIGAVLAEVIYSRLEKGLHEEAVSNRLTLWGFDLHSEFSRFTSLCDATELGLCLYYKAKSFLAEQDIPIDTLRLTVELLITSHECFTSACNMEGVVSVLTQCRGLTAHLLAQSAWSLMVRLLTGVGRYVEMGYVYQLLRENQQFEFLLRKGYDKNPGFKLATLDFVRSDKALFQLVALNFRLYAELATMFHSHATTMLTKLATSGERRLLCSENNRELLNDIIDNLTHAAQHFIQAQKLKQATSIVNQAELMSLQLDLLKSGLGSEDCLALFSIPAKDLTSVVANHLTYQQAAVVLNAYDCPIDWSLVVHTQVILRGNRSYLTAWLTNHRLSSNIVQDIVSRYQKEPKLSADMTSNMKFLIAHVKPLELKYRICSQLNFKDMLHSILGNPDVAWLKDTVWQVGYKQRGGLK